MENFHNTEILNHETNDSANLDFDEMVNQTSDTGNQRENKIVNEQEQNRAVNPGDQSFPDKVLAGNETNNSNSGERSDDKDIEDLNEEGHDQLSDPEIDDPSRKEGDSAERTKKNT